MNSPKEKLVRLEHELKELKEEYQDFAYIVSHDLSAPIRAIEGFSAIIAQRHARDFDEVTQKHFEHIIRGTNETKEILSSLLEYSRLNTRAEPFTDCDCNQCLESAKSELSSLITTTKAQIQSDALPVVLADANQINRVFYHLLQNALVYQTKSAVPDIQITCLENSDHWEFSIKDNGIGIKDNLKDRVFKVLGRAVSNKQYEGAGMGLAVVKKTLQRHQGRIWFESKPNEGSIFYLTIAKGLNND